MIRNNTSFSLQITSKIRELYNVYLVDNNWKRLLKYYQYIVKHIITNPEYDITDARGLLLYFTMGMGKTRTAASIILSSTYSNIIAILPKSLQRNFEDTMEYMQKELGFFDKKINFVSMDAYNAAIQLENVKSGLDHSLIIVDEAHNFFKSIINGETSNAYKIYEKIMNAKDIKLLFLTGTPISKDPFELVPCINMLAGFDILPIHYDQFNSLYVDHKNKEIINKSYLANRLIGLVSHMSMSEESMFPTELPLIISKVEMAHDQYIKYLHVREKEEMNKKQHKETKINNKSMQIPKQVSMSSYYVHSRSICNYYDNYSPKMELISKRVSECSGCCMVYSQFVNSHGLKQLIKYLETYSFTSFNGTDDSIQLRYALYTGEVNAQLRSKIISTFNSDTNKYGHIIKCILISKTGAEGLDLKNVRETHQLEPYWDISRNEQVKARAIRYGSHLALPTDERTVQPYIYLSIANNEIWSKLKEREPKTIDEMFYDRSVDKEIINSKFRNLLKDVSIECTYFNLRESCYVCNPSNIKLFSSDPLIDTKITNPCIQYVSEEKDANRIIVDDIEYYYTLDPLIVYKYNSLLDGYIKVNDELLIKTIHSKI